MTLRLSTALQLLHRPHLITPAAALEIAQRIRAFDPRSFERQAGPFAAMRKKGVFARALELAAAKPSGKPVAMEDDDDYAAPPPRGMAYCPLWMGEPDAVLPMGVAVKDGVAVMEICGPLAERGGWVCGDWIEGYDTIAAAIGEADANGAVRGIMIRFDTPGGVVASGLDDLAASLASRDADAKPIWAHCEMACSAGYWIASQADRVLAPKAGLVGSIGAVMVHESVAGALEKAGVKIEAIQFGAHKTDGAWWSDLSDAARADLQAMIDSIGEAFVTAVGQGRGARLSADKARATEARVFSADNADASRSGLALGLIDAVMSEQATFEALRDQVAAAIIPIRPAASATGRSTAARAASTKETDMQLRKALAALATSEADPVKFKAQALALVAQADAEAKPEAAEGDPECDCIGEEGCECDPDSKPAAGDAAADADKPDAKPAADDDAKALINPKTAQAILALPEARGREALAQRLAFKPGMTLAEAKADLLAAPKASVLADRMKDPVISADGGKPLTDDQRARAEAFANAGVKRRQR